MSKLLRYIGIHEDVFIPALNDAYVPRNGTVEVADDELADRMLEQDGWELAAAGEQRIAEAQQREEQAAAEAAEAAVANLKKAELLQLADEHGVEVPGSATKADIVAVLPPEALPTPTPTVPVPPSALAPEGPA